MTWICGREDAIVKIKSMPFTFCRRRSCNSLHVVMKLSCSRVVVEKGKFASGMPLGITRYGVFISGKKQV